MPRLILIVDDDPSDRELIVNALDRAGFPDHVSVRSAEEALGYIEGQRPELNQAPRLPALILLDIKLRTASGFEFLRELRSAADHNRIPVVMFTGSSEEDDLVRSYRDRANAYVVKPMDPAEFAVAVVHTARFWLALNRLPPRMALIRRSGFADLR